MTIDVAGRAAQARSERYDDALRNARMEEAREMLAPLFGEEPELASGTACYRALNRLHESFPELSAIEIEALVASVMRSMGKRTGR